MYCACALFVKLDSIEPDTISHSPIALYTYFNELDPEKVMEFYSN